MSNLFPQPSSGTLRSPRFRPGEGVRAEFPEKCPVGAAGLPGLRGSLRSDRDAAVPASPGLSRPAAPCPAALFVPRRPAVLPYSAVSRRTLPHLAVPHLAVPHLPLPHSAAPRGSVAGNPLSESPFSQPRDSMRVSVIRITMRLLFG